MCCRLQVYRKGKIGGNWGIGGGGEARDEEKVGRLGKGGETRETRGNREPIWSTEIENGMRDEK